MSRGLSLIGVDVGTGSTKAVAFDLQGRVLASFALEYKLYSPRPGRGEQDPEEVLQAVVEAVRRVNASLGEKGYQLAGIGLSSVFHSLVLVDHHSRPLTRCLTWADSRAFEISKRLREVTDPRKIYERTGCPLQALYLPAKIAWFKENRPDVFRQADRFISLKEYLVAHLFGEYLVDWSVASASGLLNLERLSWDSEVLDLVGISPERLSLPVSTRTVLPRLRSEWATAMGISSEIPWVIGAGDGVLSNAGSGAVGSGIVTAMVGTSGAIRVLSGRPRIDEKGRTWCYHLTDGHWVLGGAINNGGIAYRWLRDNLLGGEGTTTYADLDRYASEVPPGAEGLIFLPYLAGERSPYWNAEARGVLFGLSLSHDKKHIARATLEGVVYRMYSVFRVLEELAGTANEIRASGGFARSKLWLQIMSDVFGREVRVPDVVEGSALGAAVLAMVALGLAPDLFVAERMVSVKEVYRPQAENRAYYEKAFSLYERIYWQLQEEFSLLSELRDLQPAGRCNDDERGMQE